MVFNDEQKNDIAWQEYTKYKVGNKVKIDTDNKKKTIGYVSEVFGQAQVCIVRREVLEK